MSGVFEAGAPWASLPTPPMPEGFTDRTAWDVIHWRFSEKGSVLDGAVEGWQRDNQERVRAAMAAKDSVAGRFVLFEPMGDEDAYITSWDTWEECAVAFPIQGASVLRDDATGRVWRAGFAYEWEAAQT